MKDRSCWLVVCGVWALCCLAACNRQQTPALAPKSEDAAKRFADAFAAMWARGQECVALERRLVDYHRSVARPDSAAHVQRQDFLHRLYGIMTREHSIPRLGEYHAQIQTLKKILSTCKPELAERLDGKEVADLLGELFDGPLEWDGVRWRIPELGDATSPPAGAPLADWAAACAEYFAGWVHDYADVHQQWKGMQKELDDKLAPAMGKALLAAYPRLGGDASMDELMRSQEAVGCIQEALRKYHPEIAGAVADMIKQGQLAAVQYAQERVKKDLAELYGAEKRFQDMDGNRVRDFWTGDVSGLFRLQHGGQRLELIPARLARADGAPLAAGGPLGELPPKSPSPKAPSSQGGDRPSDFGFQAVLLDENGRPLGLDTDGSGRPWRNRERFAICAYPLGYGRVGRQTYLLTERGTIWFKDTEGKTVERLPKDPRADGWEVAVEKVAVQSPDLPR